MRWNAALASPPKSPLHRRCTLIKTNTPMMRIAKTFRCPDPSNFVPSFSHLQVATTPTALTSSFQRQTPQVTYGHYHDLLERDRVTDSA